MENMTDDGLNTFKTEVIEHHTRGRRVVFYLLLALGGVVRYVKAIELRNFIARIQCGLSKELSLLRFRILNQFLRAPKSDKVHVLTIKSDDRCGRNGDRWRQDADRTATAEGARESYSL